MKQQTLNSADVESRPRASKPSNSITIHGFSAHVCLTACQLFIQTPLRKLSLRNRATGNRFESMKNYVAERVSNVDRYERLFSRIVNLQGKTVLELGCSRGYLLNAFLERRSFSAIGADIDPDCLARARALHGDRIKFVRSTATSIPVPDNSVDVVYSIDTFEHLSRPHAILTDVHRILKPGGHFLVHFGPWYNPYGAHLEDIIPFPWPHVFFSMDTLLNVAAYLYESPDYIPACYWHDDNGNRRPNPYLDREMWHEYLNHVTIRKFKKLLRTLPFETIHFQRIGFEGKSYRLARLLNAFSGIPVLEELLISFIFCALRKRSL